MPFNNLIDRLELIPDGSGLFILKFLSGFFHRLAQTKDDGLRPAFQEFAEVINHLAVISLGDGADAGRSAKLDVIVQTSPAVFTGDLPVAGQIREDLPQQVQV